MVYVIAKDRKPLMPCSNVIARLMLKEGKAKVKRREPFTIQLTVDTTDYRQDLTLGVDTGSGTFGTAVCRENGEIVYLSEVTVRNDISRKMTERRQYRRNRRNRKTRYRKARWLNRAASIRKDRFSPTMQSKIHSHEKEIAFIQSILPITTIAIETSKFDPHRMKNPGLANPKVRSWGYQKGANYGFENTRAKVLYRDNYTCQCCNNKRKDSKLEVHHIVFRSNGGADDESNLITLCHTCHRKVHEGTIKLNHIGSRKGTLKAATQMNSICKQLLKKHPDAIETFGFVTKANRFLLGLEKTRYSDACIIATQGKPFIIRCNLYRKRHVPDGDFRKTRGIRSEQKVTIGKICGFRKFDKVRYLGKDYFIKGRMVTGYATLMDLDGTKIDFSSMPRGYKTPKLCNCRRLTARSTCMVQTVPMERHSSHGRTAMGFLADV